MIAKTFGEVCDEYTINVLKLERLNIKEHRQDALLREIAAQIGDLPESQREYADKLIADLLLANTAIWNLESDIRKCTVDKLFVGEALYIEMGKRAESIRSINAKRVETKNMLNALTGDIKEIKGDHLSS